MTVKLLLSLISLVLIASCSKDGQTTSNDTLTKQNNQSKKTHDTIYIGNGGEPPTLDPALATDENSIRISYDLFERIIGQDAQGAPIPGVAKSWEISDDGKTYTFHLHDDLKFSDGSELNADDVVASWRRAVDPKLGGPQADAVFSNIVNGREILTGKLPVEKLGVVAPNKNTVVVKLLYPDTYTLDNLYKPALAILPTKVIAKYGAEWTHPRNIVTSGAYVLTEHVRNSHIMARINPYNYDAAKVKIPKIKYLAINDQNSEYQQFQTGLLDITHSIPSDQYQSIKQKYPTELHTFPQEATYFYEFNMSLPILRDNLNLRKALVMAIDREVITDKILGIGQIPLYSVITKTIANGDYANLEYEWSTWPREKQIAEAQRLYKEAGYSKDNPLKLSLSYNTLEGNKKLAIAVSSMWKNILGAEITPQNQEWKIFLENRRKGNLQIARAGWIADTQDVNYYLKYLFLCNAASNNSHYCNQKYDNLIFAAQATATPQERHALASQAITLVMNDYPIIPLYQYTKSLLVDSRVGGYIPENNRNGWVITKWMYLKN